MLDKFGRAIGIPFPGGPEIERKAQSYIQNYGSDHILDLPYAVHGTDMAFSGILGAAIAHAKKGEDHGLVCHSLQEISFASCVEVGERAMALTGKKGDLTRGWSCLQQENPDDDPNDGFGKGWIGILA